VLNLPRFMYTVYGGRPKSYLLGGSTRRREGGRRCLECGRSSKISKSNRSVCFVSFLQFLRVFRSSFCLKNHRGTKFMSPHVSAAMPRKITY
jgi:hypothetical protein